MHVNKKTVSAVFTGAVTAAAITGLAPGQAHAAGTWFVKNNGAPYKGPFRGTGTGSIGVGAQKIPCSKAAVSASLPQSTVSMVPTNLGHITNLALSGCKILAGMFEPRLTTLPLMIVSTYANGVTKGRLGGTAGALKFTVTGIGNGCVATLSGASESFSLRNTSHHLNIDAAKRRTLRVGAATGCPFATGASAYIEGTYTLTTPSRLTISQS